MSRRRDLSAHETRRPHHFTPREHRGGPRCVGANALNESSGARVVGARQPVMRLGLVGPPPCLPPARSSTHPRRDLAGRAPRHRGRRHVPDFRSDDALGQLPFVVSESNVPALDGPPSNPPLWAPEWPTLLTLADWRGMRNRPTASSLRMSTSTVKRSIPAKAFDLRRRR
jgi:hypothetical protein